MDESSSEYHAMADGPTPVSRRRYLIAADGEDTDSGSGVNAADFADYAGPEGHGLPADPYHHLDPYLGNVELNRESLVLPEITIATQDTTYKSFQTIDWIHNEAKERAVAKRRERAALLLPLDWTFESLAPKAALFWYHAQGWVCALCIGIASGCIAAFIDVVAEFLSDIRTGHCAYAYWTTQRACCKLGESIIGCDAWISWSETLGLGADGSSFFGQTLNYFVYVGFCMLFGFVAVLLVTSFAPYAAGSGIPEIKCILSGFVLRKHLGKWTSFIKILCVPLAVSTGMALGKEGPLIHITASMGNLFSYFFPTYQTNASSRRGMIAAAASAGVSVAFGAPIGGVLFALEEIAYYFPGKVLWRAFFCSLVAATTLSLLDPFNTGKLVLFQTSSRTANWNWFELPGFMFVGAIGGVVGALFIKLNVRWCAVRKHTALKLWPKAEIAILVLISAGTNYICYFSRIDSLQLIALLFSECDASIVPPSTICVIDRNVLAIGSLVVLGITRIILMAFTAGTKVPGGIFVPSLVSGACIGRSYGSMIAALFRTNPLFLTLCGSHTVCIDPSIYAVCGAAAVLGGVSRMTIALVVIMFEITGGVSFLLPLMAAVLTARAVGDLVGHEDLYVAQIRLNEYPFLDPKVDYDVDATISALSRPFAALEVVYEHGNTVGSLAQFLEATRANGFPVLTADRGVIGYISRADLESVVSKAVQSMGVDVACVLSPRVPIEVRRRRFIDLRPFMDPTPLSVVDTCPFATACSVVKKTGARYLVITSAGRCSGIVTRKDMLAFVRAVEASNQ